MWPRFFTENKATVKPGRRLLPMGGHDEQAVLSCVPSFLLPCFMPSVYNMEFSGVNPLKGPRGKGRPRSPVEIIGIHGDIEFLAGDRGRPLPRGPLSGLTPENSML